MFFMYNETIKQPTQVQNDFERIIRMIETPAQPPKPRKKSLGRHGEHSGKTHAPSYR